MTAFPPHRGSGRADHHWLRREQSVSGAVCGWQTVAVFGDWNMVGNNSLSGWWFGT
jgi:hypothetical protein